MVPSPEANDSSFYKYDFLIIMMPNSNPIINEKGDC